MTVGPFSTTRNPLTLRQRTQKRNTVFNKCGAFLVKSDQSKHKKTHAKENIFECYEHGYAISKNTLLDIRKLSVEEIVCMCWMWENLLQTSALAHHQRTHTGRNPTDVINAREHCTTSQTSFYIRRLIRGKLQRNNDPQSNTSNNLRNAKAL